ncbi:MAG: hypothetical protein ACJ8DZ_11880 [Allosphingosinicella sp.]
MRTSRTFALLAAAASLGLALAAVPAGAQRADESASGHGTLPSVNDAGQTVKRQFSFSAQRRADGSVSGHATLVNPAFHPGKGNAPYQLEIDISCMHIVGNVAIFGGSTRRTNDPSLVDAVFFTAQDNGEPGKNDRLSRAYFWDDDPNTQGPPSACMNTGPTDFPLEPIEAGNIQVRNGVNVP